MKHSNVVFLLLFVLPASILLWLFTVAMAMSVVELIRGSMV